MHKQLIDNQIIQMKGALCLLMVLLTATAYLDIPLKVIRNGSQISYLMPFKINDLDYGLTISMENSDQAQFIRDYTEKKNEAHGNKKKHKKETELKGILSASSLEGYSFEGWKRFFMEAFLWIEQRYYHNIPIDFSKVQQKKTAEAPAEVSTGLTSETDSAQVQPQDGKITFGPNMKENIIFSQIKGESDFLNKDVVSIYRGINDKNTRVQLGGYEDSYAKGDHTGVLFYEMDIIAKGGKWRIPVKSVNCTRQKVGKDDNFVIGRDPVSLAISLESSYMVLPKKLAEGIERNFEGANTECNITEESRLVCKNMTSIDLALNTIEFKIDEGVYINISLYDLRDSYNETDKSTTFFLKFTDDEEQWQIGEALFRSYYVSIDMAAKQMLFSPLNRFPSESFGVYIVRFIVGFFLFTVIVAVGAMIWQFFGDPFRKNKITYGEDGIKLVSYDKPRTFESNYE